MALEMQFTKGKRDKQYFKIKSFGLKDIIGKAENKYACLESTRIVAGIYMEMQIK